jgi:UDP-glucuronate decarboxylase
MMKTSEEIVGPINLGNPFEFTIRQLAEKIIGLTGSPSRIEFRPLPANDPRQRKPDISKAIATLGWMPSTALDKGLLATIAHFEQLLNRGGPLPLAAQTSVA